MSKYIPLAFPNTGNSTWSLQPDTGMELRDYFAAASLPAILNLSLHEGASSVSGKPLTEADFAEQAYAFADAMLEAREKRDD